MEAFLRKTYKAIQLSDFCNLSLNQCLWLYQETSESMGHLFCAGVQKRCAQQQASLGKF